MSNKESTLIRFGVSMQEELAAQFDQLIAEQGYENRSEAIRDLVRKALLDPVQHSATQMVAGTIVMVYDHHASDLPITLMNLQHKFHSSIISTMHIHLNSAQCLEIIVVRGIAQQLRELHNQIQVQKGVLHTEMSVTHFDQNAIEHHSHNHSHIHDHSH